MKASEFIKILETHIEEHGDLEIFAPQGEMYDPEFVVGVSVVAADITEHIFRTIHIPWAGDNEPIMNAKLFKIETDYLVRVDGEESP